MKLDDLLSMYESISRDITQEEANPIVREYALKAMCELQEMLKALIDEAKQDQTKKRQ